MLISSTVSKQLFLVLVAVIALWQYGVVRNTSLINRSNQQQVIKAVVPTDDDDSTTYDDGTASKEQDIMSGYVHSALGRPMTDDDAYHILQHLDDDFVRMEFNGQTNFNFTNMQGEDDESAEDEPAPSDKNQTASNDKNNKEEDLKGNSTSKSSNNTGANHSLTVPTRPPRIGKNSSSTLVVKNKGKNDKSKDKRKDKINSEKDNTADDETEEGEYTSYRNKKKMEPHLIAWYSAGVFVLLGLPISLYGIIMHLKHYNQPHIQVYIVRILWMVPIYSMESWLCLRYHSNAIYIETLRDFYESYVLYSFLQFLIQVLGGEEELILMLKDKSPTRGFHMWGMQYCCRPWLMGQPVSRLEVCSPAANTIKKKTLNDEDDDDDDDEEEGASTTSAVSMKKSSSFEEAASITLSAAETAHRKRVQWTSPFFVKCKFGVLQYVLLKFVLGIITMILELCGVYKEGNFTPNGGYLYICILTNLSQCWALYCLILFYFATVTELSPIRPVGKFLSVKAIVFFTWWQSVCISLFYQANLIPHYHGDEPDYQHNWTPEDVAKGLQDYIICIEMFIASLVHVFVFPHTDYLPHAVKARNDYHDQMMQLLQRRRIVGRLHQQQQQQDPDASSQPSSPKLQKPPQVMPSQSDLFDVNDISEGALIAAIHAREDFQPQAQPIANLVEAFIDSTPAAIPRDLIQNSAGIIRGEYYDVGKNKQTLLHHATTSDSHDLFSSAQTKKRRITVGRRKRQQTAPKEL